jgi:hypothetical protein
VPTQVEHCIAPPCNSLLQIFDEPGETTSTNSLAYFSLIFESKAEAYPSDVINFIEMVGY